MSQTLGGPGHPRTLAKRIAERTALHPQAVIRSYGVVVSLQAGPPRTLTITIGADPTPVAGIPFRASYNHGTAPAPGDVVIIDRIGRYHEVVDTLAT